MLLSLSLNLSFTSQIIFLRCPSMSEDFIVEKAKRLGKWYEERVRANRRRRQQLGGKKREMRGGTWTIPCCERDIHLQSSPSKGSCFELPHCSQKLTISSWRERFYLCVVNECIMGTLCGSVPISQGVSSPSAGRRWRTEERRSSVGIA